MGSPLTCRSAPWASGASGWWSLSILAAVVCLFASCQLGGYSDPADHPAVGLELPELDLRGLTNASEMMALGDIRGQVVLLNFWATWCGPCLAELPEMTGLAARMESENSFRLLSVVVAPAQSEGEFEDLRLQVQAVLDELEIDSMTTYADPQGSTFDGFLDLSGRESVGVPTNVLVDRQGVIRAVWLGFRPGVTEEMESYVRGLL